MKRKIYTFNDVKRMIGMGLFIDSKDILASWESERSHVVELNKKLVETLKLYAPLHKRNDADFSFEKCPHGHDDWSDCPVCGH
jgi:hypothetical protein